MNSSARHRRRPVQLQILVRGPAGAGPPPAGRREGAASRYHRHRDRVGGGAGAALALSGRTGRRRGGDRAAGRQARLRQPGQREVAQGHGARATPFGSVLNEVGDRAAELAALAGCLAFAPAALVLAAALAATLPSWVALAGAAAGLERIQGGPVGKTERCLLLALLAAVGCPVALLAALSSRLRRDRPGPAAAAGAGRQERPVSGLAGTAECLAGVLTLGGVGAFASGNREVIRKWRTWMVSAPLAAGCLWLGAPGAALLAAGLGVTASIEYGRLAKLRTADSALLAAVAVILPAVAWRMPADLGRALAGALLAVALVPVLGGDAETGSRRAAAGVFGAGWLAALTGLVLLHATALPLIFAVSVADVGAWCAGRLLGGPALPAVAREMLDRNGRRGAGGGRRAGGGSRAEREQRRHRHPPRT